MANNDEAVIIAKLEDAISTAKEKPTSKKKVITKISLALAAADELKD